MENKTMKIIGYVMAAVLIVLLSIIASNDESLEVRTLRQMVSNLENQVYELENSPPKVDTVFVDSFDVDWFLLKLAMMMTESKFNPQAVSSVGAKGPLQIMDIYVKECNRIVGYERFFDDDKTCFVKSLQMFEVIQNHHNKERSIERAIRRHNPNAGNWYYERTMAYFDMFKTILEYAQ